MTQTTRRAARAAVLASLSPNAVFGYDEEAALDELGQAVLRFDKGRNKDYDGHVHIHLHKLPVADSYICIWASRPFPRPLVELVHVGRTQALGMLRSVLAGEYRRTGPGLYGPR